MMFDDAKALAKIAGLPEETLAQLAALRLAAIAEEADLLPLRVLAPEAFKTECQRRLELANAQERDARRRRVAYAEAIRTLQVGEPIVIVRARLESFLSRP